MKRLIVVLALLAPLSPVFASTVPPFFPWFSYTQSNFPSPRTVPPVLRLKPMILPSAPLGSSLNPIHIRTNYRSPGTMTYENGQFSIAPMTLPSAPLGSNLNPVYIRTSNLSPGTMSYQNGQFSIAPMTLPSAPLGSSLNPVYISSGY